MGLPFYVDERVLIPRFDTESMCEDAVRNLPQGAAVLDLCTGSGAIAVAIKKLRKDVSMHAADLSADALVVARMNARQNGADVTFYEGDLFAPLQGRQFDAILSNPPYIPLGEKATLQAEVLREPALALFAGEDGMALYQRLIAQVPAHLKAGGLVYLEIGDGEEACVRHLLEAHFTQITSGCDLSGRIRYLRAVLK